MRLSTYTDYSLRLLMHVALNDKKLVTIQEVAEAFAISRNHLMKVAFELGRHGFLETVRGRNGGLRLARDPAQISLGEIVRATEFDFNMVECFDASTNACTISGPCRLRGILTRALKAWLSVLDDHTLADLTRQNQALSKLLLSA